MEECGSEGEDGAGERVVCICGVSTHHKTLIIVVFARHANLTWPYNCLQLFVAAKTELLHRVKDIYLSAVQISPKTDQPTATYLQLSVTSKKCSGFT